MTKRKNRTGISNIFDDQGAESNVMLRTARPPRPKGGVAITSYNLALILPDPDQPRRLIPADLSEQLFSGEMTPAEVLNQLEQARKVSFAKIVSLADSIEEKGLIQPIKIRPVPPEQNFPNDIMYLVVVGERRWWAHMYLFIHKRQVNGTPAGRIRAELSTDNDRIRAVQWAENYDREDISAVEKAQAILLVKAEMGQRGKATWEEVQKELGISKSTRFRLTSVLDLSEPCQELIIAHELPERAIRPIVVQLKDQPKLQLKALQHLIKFRIASESEDGTNSQIQSLEALIEDLLGDADKKVAKKGPKTARLKKKPYGTWKKESKGTLKWLGKMQNVSFDDLTDRQRGELLKDAEAILGLVESIRENLG